MFSARFRRYYTWQQNSKNVVVCSLMLGIPVPELFLMLSCLLMNWQNTRRRSVLMIALFWDETCSPTFGVICPLLGPAVYYEKLNRSVAGSAWSRRCRLWWLQAGRSGAWTPVGVEFFRTRPDRPRGPPILLYIGYFGSFPWVRRPGRGVNHPPPSNAELKEEVEMCLYSRLCLYGMLLDGLYLYRSEKVRFLLGHVCVTSSRRISKW